MKNIYTKLKKIFLNKDELKFIINNKNQKKIPFDKKKKTIIFAMPMDYFFLLYWKLLIKENFIKKYNLICLWTLNISPKKKRFFLIQIVHFVGSKLFYYFLKLKWIKLYSSIGITHFENTENYNFFDILKSFFDSFKIYKKIKKKKDLNKINYQNIYLGDLINDTFIRFKMKPTIDLNSLSLFHIIYKTILSIKKLNYIKKKYNIKKYIGSDAVYIHNGVPIRVFKKEKINCYSCGELFNFITEVKSKYHSNTDVLSYNSEFKKLNFKKQKLLQAKNQMNLKFKGVKDKSGMGISENPFLYKKQHKSLRLEKINGVMFLHDFYDAPHYYGPMLFSDHYDWTVETLKIIRQYRLPIAVKEHPNAIYDSRGVYNDLKKRFPDILWLPKDISNSYLLKLKNINFAISNYGSVLYEMAYLNKYSLSAGLNRTSSFSFTFNPKNISNYKKILIKLSKKTNNKKKNFITGALKTYYISYMQGLEDIRSSVKDINLNQIRIVYNKNLHGNDKSVDLSKMLIYYDGIINNLNKT
ncbi:hypothetical protein N8143_03210 [Pelagibacteraceae bacterium]|nr:hypothetical protein [Pelagibacteraceae bacterium]